jgi:hypothetical protein
MISAWSGWTDLMKSGRKGKNPFGEDKCFLKGVMKIPAGSP